MRDIKFRAWNKISKEMYGGLPYSNAKGNDDLKLALQHPQVYEVMQYTGLKDKNGVEIYEGDILKNISNILVDKVPIEIIYSVCDGSLFWRDGKDNLDAFYESIALNSGVIGNIYENPKLLKEEEEE